MKKVILAALFAVISMSSMAQKVKGSDTVLPLAQKQAEAYGKANSSSDVSITGGGSGVGISALLEGSTDIAMASRKIKITERSKLKDAGKEVVEKVIARDALAVIVNPQNKINELTREQLEGIFTGKITNWKEVGGADLKIVVYSRETSSGTYEFFKSSVLNKKNYMASVLSMPATGAIIQSISQTPGAIGYVGLAYIIPAVKAIGVSYDQGANYYTPSIENAMNGHYPIVRPLYFYYTKDNEAKAKGFVDFVMSAAGQKVVSEIGYVTNKQ